MSLEEILNVEIVSATKTSQKLSEAPAIISVITAQQIRERGYRNVAEAINSIPGVDILTDHLKYNMGVRGVNAGQRAWSRIVKVMIDNQAVSFRPTTENWLGESLIPINVIERIEIIRGPSSALYGANAFLGVINIITKKGEQIDGGEAMLKEGFIQNQLSFGHNFLVGKKIDDFDFIFAMGSNHINRSGLKVQNLPNATKYSETNNQSQNDTSQPTSIFTRLTLDNDTIGKISLDANYQYLNSFAEFQDWGVLTHNNKVALQNAYIRGSYSKAFQKNFTTNISLAYSQGSPLNLERLTINQQGVADWLTRDLSYSGLDLAIDTTYQFFDKNSLTFGLDFTRDHHEIQTFYRNFMNKSREVIGTKADNKDFINSGLFLQGIVYPFQILKNNPLEKLNFTSGLRYDFHNIYGNVLNYRVGSTYPITEKIYTKILYGTSFKAPGAVQLFTGNMFPGGVIGNPNLKPEQARTFEGAIGAELLPGLYADLTGFYSNIDSLVELVKDPNLSNVKGDNKSNISSYGLESELKYRFDQLSTYLNFSYQKSSLTRQDNFGQSQLVDSRLYPTFMAKFGSNYKLPQYFLNVNLEGRYIHSRIASDQNIGVHDPVNFKAYSLSPYFLLDLTLSSDNLKFFNDKETRIIFKINNILGQEYYFPGFKDFDIQGLNRHISANIIQYF